MAIRWLFAAVHLLALGVGLGAVWARARALKSELDPAGLRRVFYADTWWGVAALLWIGTGLVRAFGGLEKGGDYYLHNHLFQAKMAVLILILLLELPPLVTLIRWRTQLARASSLTPGRRAPLPESACFRPDWSSSWCWPRPAWRAAMGCRMPRVRPSRAASSCVDGSSCYIAGCRRARSSCPASPPTGGRSCRPTAPRSNGTLIWYPWPLTGRHFKCYSKLPVAS